MKVTQLLNDGCRHAFRSVCSKAGIISMISFYCAKGNFSPEKRIPINTREPHTRQFFVLMGILQNITP